MEKGKERYIIEIKYLDGNEDKPDFYYDEEVDIYTDDINWSMEQYKRNRPPLDWKIKYHYTGV